MGSGGKARVQQRSSGQPHPRQAEETENAVPYQEEWEAVAVFRVEHVALSNQELLIQVSMKREETME